MDIATDDALIRRFGRLALIAAALVLATAIYWRVAQPTAPKLAPEVAAAVESARALTRDRPQDAGSWSAYGAALVSAGPGTVTAEALDAFQRANRLNPREPRARFFLGVAKGERGDAKSALDDWFALLADSPPDAAWVPVVRGAIDSLSSQAKIDVAARRAALGSPGPTAEQVTAARAQPKGEQEAMIAGMVEGLAGKLQANPRNPEGWIMLMRSYATLGRNRDAAAAYRTALAANPDAKAQLDAAAKTLGVAP